MQDERLNLLLKTGLVNELLEIFEYLNLSKNSHRYMFIEQMFINISNSNEEIHYFLKNPTAVKIMMSWLGKKYQFVF